MVRNIKRLAPLRAINIIILLEIPHKARNLYVNLTDSGVQIILLNVQVSAFKSVFCSYGNDPNFIGPNKFYWTKAMLLWLCGYICFYNSMSRRRVPT